MTNRQSTSRVPPASSRSGTPGRTLFSLIPEPVRDLLPLALLAAGMLYSNSRFSFIDDEVLILEGAAQPVRTIVAAFRSGAGMNEHPPLYDLLLHFWLELTGGAFLWLRVPAILFFLAGLWMLSRSAKRLGGERSAAALLWVGALWPYGFHYGRLAGWYSFVFLLVSALTWAYLCYCESPSARQWAVVCVLSAALLYTNYFGWVLVALLGCDYWLRNRQRKGTIGGLVLTASLLFIAFIPLWRVFRMELATRAHVHQSWKVVVLNAGYNAYVLVVSEAMGPWFWRFGVPATIGVAASLVLIFWGVRGAARRFLIFGTLLMAVMALLGILYTRRLMVVAPWFVLPTAVAFGTVEDKRWRFAAALSLAGAAAIGWYGTVVQRYYAAPRFVEPWQELASETAGALRDHATVLSNSEPFFFYLTYAVQAPPEVRPWRFSGVLPDAVRYPGVWSPEDWVAAGRPLTPYVVWIRGVSPVRGPNPLRTLRLGSASIAAEDSWTGIWCTIQVTSGSSDSSRIWASRPGGSKSGSTNVLTDRRRSRLSSPSASARRPSCSRRLPQPAAPDRLFAASPEPRHRAAPAEWCRRSCSRSGRY